ncbi:PPE family protein [Mycobacterium sp.]|uniref:PPE family protein n=1 Tax=Mycobacterium sp. TaxID=1785 RepID=UPI003C794B11
MIPAFSWLPPEINSALIFGGAGSGPLFATAEAWAGLASELGASAASFDSVIAALTGGPWAGPASVSMAAAATPYVGWLSGAAAQAQLASSQAVAAATAFETALTSTVHPAAVDTNRLSLTSLIATNFLGQNTPAIAATEFDYVEMWAQDVAAMLGYHAGATSVATTLTPFSLPPTDLAGLASGVTAQMSGAVAALGATVAPVADEAAVAASALVVGVQSLASSVPISSLSQVAQIGMYPASMLISPMMSLAQSANAGSAASLAGATAAGVGADMPKLVGDVSPAAHGVGGVGGLGGGGMGAGLGQARLVGAMSVPPTWQGSMPKGMSTAAMSGLGAMNPAAMAQAAQATGAGGMPMMPMPMGMGGAGAGMPPGMMGRGGANPHVVQNRPSVIPRTGVG